ncbi:MULTISPECIES: alpha/beta hydrolase [Gordonia]|uniref:Alpha/beta hydrolase n=1 Tax=Gordonia alkanivorans CGMCC 6845 TaxID=1423140 RepID=W9DL30_9ACTN|nr:MULTISPECIES: alpha/beta hydrolase [Gordonia]ETA07946.1 alpha/beta hydrolase [Gordonia alkanivorans CGMCC 6845]MDH3009689.1 alpha/beta hydrolase [Gordonia alkanivorans]MDH3018764.1 alpha/beta hydrolase [Gordonia alkanivorans]MDJ0026696.1 alpha/beta hydrolase [Gordonia alkanivorans]OLT47467.1 alpha/beta hydrolase [Gordonia sp. CNJ-863]
MSVSAGTGWQPDRFLDHYQLRTIPLGDDPDGESPVTATLIRRAEAGARIAGPRPVAGAVLYVHGFTDYFFHEPLADFFTARGYAFYAIDLRKCGRSRESHHTAHFTTDLARYDEELGLALELIAEEVGADTRTIIAGHSTGGLITALWLDRLREQDPARHGLVDGLLLNSPWLDLQGDAVLRTLPVTMLIKAVAAVQPTRVIPQELSSAYGESLHESAHGEWSYDLALKPMGGFPVTFGFLNAVRSGQRRLHRGIDVGTPALVLRSDKTHFAKSYSASTDRADVVLDVRQIARWSGCLGGRVSTVPIPDARHDVFLSVPHAREQAYREVDDWLTHTIRPATESSETSRKESTL